MNGEQYIRRAVVDACLILAANGHEHFFLGHVSARSGRSDAYWIKPTGIGLGEMTEDDPILLSLDGEPLSGERKPHQESWIHSEIYRARGDVHAVVHTHPANVGAFVAADVPFKYISQDSVLFVDGIARYDDPRLVVTSEQGRALADSLGGSSVVLMRNHGVTVAGESIQSAVVLAVSLERSLEIQRLAMALGPVREITAEEAREMAAYFAASTRQRMDLMYAWLLRQATSQAPRAASRR